MDKRIIVVGVAVIGIGLYYYISSTSKPQEDFYTASGGSGSGGGSIILPPAPTTNNYTTNYNLPDVNMPNVDLSGLPKPDYTSKSTGGSSNKDPTYGGTAKQDAYGNWQSIAPKNTIPQKPTTYSQPIGPGLQGSPGPSMSAINAVQTQQSILSGTGKAYNAIAPILYLPSISTYNKIAAAVPGLPTTTTLKGILGW